MKSYRLTEVAEDDIFDLTQINPAPAYLLRRV